MFRGNQFVALDLETTGLDSSKEEIIEVGLILFEDGVIQKEFSSTVNPGKTVSDNILLLTGIRQEELDKSPTIDTIIPDIEDFIGDLPIVGHNISFDTDFLSYHMNITNPAFDTFVISKIFLPFARSHKLSYLADYLDIQYDDAHRACEDARMCGWLLIKTYEIMTDTNPEVLKRLIDILRNKHKETDILERALKESLKKGLNRKSYPFEIPVNFREKREKHDTAEIKNISEYFKNENLEKRPSQIKMAEMVYSSLIGEEFLIVEASAGTGKSLAYLIPAVIITRNTDEPIYISSYTKTLQQQLFSNDIPHTEQVTGFGVNTLLRKGRGNYLCLLKLRNIPTGLNPVSLSALYLWSSLTLTGDLSEISHIFRDINIGLINIDESCRKEKCPFFNSCYYYNMIKKVKNADLILVNHTLFFTGNPNAGMVIFDEAHEIEKAATSGYSIAISYPIMQSVLNNLIRELTSNEMTRDVKNLIEKTKDAFKSLGEIIINRDDYRVGFYRDLQLSTLRAISEKLDNLIKRIVKTDFESEEVLIRLKELLSNMRILINQNDNERVFHYEVANRYRPESIEFVGAPLDIGPYLEEFLYPNLNSIIFTSATLSVGESFDFMKYILGLTKYGERLDEISLPDTYNFREQALTIVPTYLSLPDEKAYIKDVSQFIRDNVLTHNKGTLVLFTSYDHMRRVYREIKDDFENTGRELLIQGYGKSRSKLLSMFKESKGSVLLGTGSFWQGIDVPGKALEMVLIEKLPFPNPSDPFIGAKAEYFERRGLGGFSSYMLPLSVLRFKQGFGRLIRSTRDMGVVFVLDKRVINKSYGSVFLESLPTSISIVNNSLEVNKAIKEWFEEGKIYNSGYMEDNWEPY